MTGQSVDDPFESMTVVDIAPEDTLVFRVKHSLPLAQRKKLQDVLQAQFPENRVVILDPEIEMAILRSV